MKCWQIARLMLLSIAMVSPASAEDLLTVELPARVAPKIMPFSKQSGLHLACFSAAPKSAGYRPIECTINARKTKPVDRQFTIRFFIRTWSQNNQKIITVEQSGELAAGAKQSSVALRLPQPGNWDYGGVEVFVDGRRDDELCQEYLSTNTNLGPTGVMPEFQIMRIETRGSPPMLQSFFGDFATAALERYQQSFQQQAFQGTANVLEHATLSGLTVEDIQASLQMMPLDYTTYDAVVISKRELEASAKNSPELLEKLLRWVASGGQLWIEGFGEPPEKLAATVDLLPHFSGWRTTSLPAKPAFGPNGLDWERVQPKQPDTPLDAASAPLNADSSDWYLKRRWGFGEIYVFHSNWSDLSSSTVRQNRGLMQAIVNDTVAHWRSRAWAPRHGLQPDAANSEYSTFLIPGVGLAPVLEFEILITLFVLIIGPLNYLLLRAYDRLHLMVLTTPLCALVASAGLFGYAVIADGFGAKARLRSVTLLDQASGEMANLGRVSLYAGITPSEGLSVPADTAIYPILPGWNENSPNEVRQPPKELVWTDTEQRLTEGWIPSRTTAQYYTLRANQTERKLRIVAAPDKVRVTNELGAEIEWLFVNDDANQTWIGPKLAVDASAQLKPIAKLDAVGQFRELCLAADPQFPAGYDSNMSVNNPRNRRGLRRQANGTWQPLDYSNIAAGNSLMEQYLDELSGLTGAEALNLPPRTYVAITAKPTEQPVPLKDAVQLSGFHVMVGRW